MVQKKKAAKKKVLGITINEKITFTSYLGNITKQKDRPKALCNKQSKMLHSLWAKKIIMSVFMKSQLSCCPLIWMFWSRTSINKLNNIHKKCLRLVPNHHDSNFNELLESSHKLSIHKSFINYLMIEVYKYSHGLSPELMTDIFTLQEILATFTIVVYLALKIHY